MNNTNIVKYQDDIYAFENLLSAEECKSVVDLINAQSEYGLHEWVPISFYESFTIGYPPVNHELFNKFNLPGDFFPQLQKKIEELTASVAGSESGKMSNIGLHVQRWDVGSYAHYHSDNSDNDGNLGAFERSRYAAFLYLNEDFEGGTLEFKDPNLIITPKAGTLMAFHGGHKNIHRVNMVTGGHRYTIGSFWDDKEYEDYPEAKRKMWEDQLRKDRESQQVLIKDWSKAKEEGFKILPNGEKYKFVED